VAAREQLRVVAFAEQLDPSPRLKTSSTPLAERSRILGPASAKGR
jgi:hypothetical protein